VYALSQNEYDVEAQHYSVVEQPIRGGIRCALGGVKLVVCDKSGDLDAFEDGEDKPVEQERRRNANTSRWTKSKVHLRVAHHKDDDNVGDDGEGEEPDAHVRGGEAGDLEEVHADEADDKADEDNVRPEREDPRRRGGETTVLLEVVAILEQEVHRDQEKEDYGRKRDDASIERACRRRAL